MKLLVDIGNTRTKMAIVKNGHMEILSSPVVPSGVSEAWVSATGDAALINQLIESDITVYQLSANSNLPIAIDYSTPHTLGSDRIAAACAAWSLCNSACIVIDAGTCITIDYVDANATFEGGAILPGICMRNKAMHNFTSRLPLININNRDLVYTGKSTDECIWAGIATAVKFEIEGFVSHYRQYNRNAKVYISGGDAERIASWIDAEQVQDMVLKGLFEVSNRKS